MLVETFRDPKKQRNSRYAVHIFNGRNGSVSKETIARNGQNGVDSDQKMSEFTGKFQNPFGACNFIVTWDGEDVRELFAAIQVARQSGDRFIQDKLIEYILNISERNPRPKDIPAFVGKPVWAVDHHGRALIGMPGSETIVDASTLREQMKLVV